MDIEIRMTMQNPITFNKACEQVRSLRCLGLTEREIEIIYEKYGYESFKHVKSFIYIGLNFTQILHMLEYIK